MAVWLVRLLDGADPAAVGSSRFADVDESEWWAPYVERLADLGVTDGCATEPARFCPTETVTRGRMASFLVRAFGLAGGRSGRFVDTGGQECPRTQHRRFDPPVYTFQQRFTTQQGNLLVHPMHNQSHRTAPPAPPPGRNWDSVKVTNDGPIGVLFVRARGSDVQRGPASRQNGHAGEIHQLMDHARHRHPRRITVRTSPQRAVRSLPDRYHHLTLASGSTNRQMAHLRRSPTSRRTSSLRGSCLGHYHRRIQGGPRLKLGRDPPRVLPTHFRRGLRTGGTLGCWDFRGSSRMRR